MTTKNTGGPAFPVTATDRSGQIAPTEFGMTLRDWFAGQALVGLLSDPICEGSNDPFGQYAEASYRYADAMLEARDK